jgi:hypothetical protein
MRRGAVRCASPTPIANTGRRNDPETNQHFDENYAAKILQEKIL